MDGDNNLNISITAIDEASEVFVSVAEEAATMGEEMAATAEEINGSLDSMTGGVEGFSAAFESSVAAYEASVASMGEASIAASEEVTAGMDEMAVSTETAMGAMDASVATWDESLAGLAETMGATTTEITASVGTWEESLTALTEVMSTDTAAWKEEMLSVGTTFDEAATMIVAADDEIIASNTSLHETMKNAGLLALGIAADQVGKKLFDFYKGTLDVEAGAQTALANIKTNTENLIEESGQVRNPQSAVGREMKNVNDKINEQAAAISLLNAPISGYNKTIQQLHAEEAQHSAQLQIHLDKYHQLIGQLDLFTNMQKMAGVSVEEVTEAFDKAARANTRYGFGFDESLQSLSQLEAGTGDYKTALKANELAMDIAAEKHVSLASASTAVSQAFAGNGRALTALGVRVRDGIAGNDVLEAGLQAVGNAYQNQGGTITQTIESIHSTWDMFKKDLGDTQTGPLAEFAKALLSVITHLDNFARAHPKVTEAVLLFMGILGAALVVFGLVIAAIAAVDLAVSLVGGAFVAGFAIVVGVVAVALTFLILNFNLVKEFFTKWGGAIIELIVGPVIYIAAQLALHWKEIVAAVEEAFNKLGEWWKEFWHGFTTIVTDAVDAIKKVIQDVIDLASKAVNAVGKIPGVSQALGAAKAVAGAVGSVIPHLAEGGIVSSPTLALIGEAGPEAVVPLSGYTPNGGGGLGNGAINVYITGTVMSTENQARMYANEIAKSLIRSMKVQSFR